MRPNRKYFLARSNAEVLIELVNYLNDNEIEEEQLQDKNVLTTIIRDGMKKYVNQPPPLKYLDTIKSTVLTFTMDYLKVVNLYRINDAVLLVGCVEYLLFPDVEDKELRKIYHCGNLKAKKIYNKLSGFPEQKEQNDNIVIAARQFFECQIFIRKSEFLKTIRNYLRGLEIDSNELQFIRTKSIEVIKEKAAKVISQLQVNLDSIEDNLLTSAPELSVSKSVNHKSILPNSIKIIKRNEQLLITQEYLNARCNAEVIINLQEYLIFEEVEKENLDDENLSNIIRKVNQKQPVDIAKSARYFFCYEAFLKENGRLKAIRSYLNAISDYIDNDELSYARDTSIQLIHDYAAKYRVEPTQIDPIDDH
uniref:Uncharacterized protein n=1 Tax=Trichogramma kaykai TaxID=54128 RepID=A0ABD2XNU2_9HYME